MLQVIIKQVLSEEIISVLYIDYGTSSKVHFKDVRLIHKKFLSLPAQPIPARLWGITENEDMVSISRSKLTKMMIVGNFSNKGEVFCRIEREFTKRRPESVISPNVIFKYPLVVILPCLPTSGRNLRNIGVTIVIIKQL